MTTPVAARKNSYNQRQCRLRFPFQDLERFRS